MSTSPSSKHYEPVQHHEESNDPEDFHAIPMQTSDDSDDKTEPTSNLNRQNQHLSFDLEEEDEDDLQRYRLSPSTSTLSLNHGENVLSKKLTFTTMWQAYLELRLEHRRRRAEQLLTMNEDSLRERLVFTFSAWTDLLDTRGLLLHFLLLILWLVLCHVYSKKQKTIVVLGILCIILRLSWRPIYWYVWGRRQEQKRQETMAIYDGLNHGSSWNNSHDEEEENPPNIV